MNNKKKKNLQFYINTETQQWTRRTRRKNSFDLINFPFANFKIIPTNEPFNSIIKHNQSNNAWKHGRSKCRFISTSKKKKKKPPQRRNVQSRIAIDSLSKFRSMTKIHKLCYACLLRDRGRSTNEIEGINVCLNILSFFLLEDIIKDRYLKYLKL